MNPEILNKYFTTQDYLSQEQISGLFDALESLNGVFYAIVLQEKGKYKLLFISPSTQYILGYPLEKFSYHTGFSFIYSITPVLYRKSILDQETFYFNMARAPGLDLTQPFFATIRGALESSDKKVFQAHMVSVILEFTSQRTPYFAINTWWVEADCSETEVSKKLVEIQGILTDIHKFYNPSFDLKTCEIASGAPVRLSYPLYDFDELTNQEYQVLKLLANGCSSKAIAGKLNISHHTAESHRKHLLEKFKAVNVAQMIKMATKVYWFE